MRGLIFALAVLYAVVLPTAGWAGDMPIEKSLDDAVAAGKLKGLHSVLVIHKGKIIAERYYSGRDERWGQDLGVVEHDAKSLHDLRSVTKSVTGLLYGIALAEGIAPELDASLLEQFPQYPDLQADPQRAKITIRNTLSMKMGTEWNEDLPYTDPRNSEIAMEMAEDRYRFVLDRPMVNEPGDWWTYNGGATAVIGHLIAKGAGKPLDEYAKEKLFAPLGITEFDWIQGSDGVPSPASGLRLNIHDLAKIGRMVLAGGTWEGKQIVPADWLKQSFTPHAKLEFGLRYGLFWWLSNQGDPPGWAAGFGNGGQRLTIDRNGELVVAVFAGNYNQPDAWKVPVAVIMEHVVPGLQR